MYREDMSEQTLMLSTGQALGAVVSLGPVNMVYIRKPGGFLGCGLFDVAVLDRFGIAGATVTGVATLDDLLNGRVSRVNRTAEARGIREGMTGREALEKM